MSSARVSVVIPTYNRAVSLRRLLAALDACQRPAGGVEIIVVDDGSTDDTKAVAEHAGVHYLSQPNYGPACARERGWRSASGDVIVFLDDDVVPAPDAVCKLCEALQTADGVGARIVPLDPAPVVAHYMHADGLVNHRIVNKRVHYLITAASAFRREALEQIGGFDLTFPRAAGEDVDLTRRLIEAGFVLRVAPDALVQHDHRSRFRGLLSTCYRYGTAYRLLARRHSAVRFETWRNAALRLNPFEWVRLYNRYRAEVSMLRSLAFLALHLVVVAPYGWGVLNGIKVPADPGLIRDIDLPADGLPVEILGGAQPLRRDVALAAEEGAPAA